MISGGLTGQFTNSSTDLNRPEYSKQPTNQEQGNQIFLTNQEQGNQIVQTNHEPVNQIVPTNLGPVNQIVPTNLGPVNQIVPTNLGPVNQIVWLASNSKPTNKPELHTQPTNEEPGNKIVPTNQEPVKQIVWLAGNRPQTNKPEHPTQTTNHKPGNLIAPANPEPVNQIIWLSTSKQPTNQGPVHQIVWLASNSTETKNPTRAEKQMGHNLLHVFSVEHYDPLNNMNSNEDKPVPQYNPSGNSNHNSKPNNIFVEAHKPVSSKPVKPSSSGGLTSNTIFQHNNIQDTIKSNVFINHITNQKPIPSLSLVHNYATQDSTGTHTSQEDQKNTTQISSDQNGGGVILPRYGVHMRSFYLFIFFMILQNSTFTSNAMFNFSGTMHTRFYGDQTIDLTISNKGYCSYNFCYVYNFHFRFVKFSDRCRLV